MLLLIALAGQSLAPAAAIVPSGCVWESGSEDGDKCASEAPAESCPPVCAHCPCCFAAQIYLPEIVASSILLNDAGHILPPGVELPVWALAEEIFHIPENA
jgi:hypothetical protein